ncbi:cyclohexanecarboxylate-CoA ligase (plasmid) [Salinigranum rubrum]|uniref:Cyclohexanecarboxylate-CoA ligase n=2 Tax=Salinigranum rubrum TaxID=755307 RepID=A0A2I8VRV0_9EURY|nr:cyclohexanecarboxylate-CoA ligase [Salinigranum rubrum]
MRPSLWTPEKCESFVENGWWPNKTILDYVSDSATDTPDRVALVDERTTYTYAELADAVDNVALGLVAHGVEPDNMLAVQLPNRIEGVVVHLAAIRAGAIPNPIVTIYRENELRYMLDKLDSVAYFAVKEHCGFDFERMIRGIADEFDALENVFVLDDGEALVDETRSLTALFETDWAAQTDSDHRTLDDREVGPNDTSLVLFTSGTTGMPKGVMHTENTLLSAMSSQIDVLGLTSDDVIFAPSPIGHLTAIQNGYRAAFMLGTACVLQEQWDGSRALEWIESEGATYTAGATTFLTDMTNSENFEEYDTSSLRLMMTGGAPIPPEAVQEAHEQFENLTVCRGWGQTENTLPTINFPTDPTEALRTKDGRPYDGMEVRIASPETFDAALPGETGELQVRGPFLFLGYYDDPERTAASFTADGWLKTGDKASIDDDGYVTIEGRLKDVIIRGGENIPVREVEADLRDHPSVGEVALVAMPDERLQERACAYVRPADPATPPSFEEVINYLTERGYITQRLPERLELIDEFPRNAIGKIQRYKLREDVAEQLDMDPVTR